MRRTVAFAQAKCLQTAATGIYAARAGMGLTVQEAVDAYCLRKEDLGKWEPITCTWNRRELERFAALGPKQPIASVDTVWLVRHLSALAHLALASQRTRFAAVLTFCTWCVERGWMPRHPLLGLDQDELPWVGKRAARRLGRGKDQLRNTDEVEAYLQVARRLPDLQERVAAQLPLLSGLRSGEVRHLRAADVDLRIGRLWIRSDPGVWDVKTAHSGRAAVLADELLDDMAALRANKLPTALLFGNDKGQSRPYKWLLEVVDRVCGEARTDLGPVQRVTPHGLRGTYATILTMAGGAALDIAKALGHGDRGQTVRGHYAGVPTIQPSLRAVAGGKR